MNDTVKINGSEYPLASLGKTAREMLRNIEAADTRLKQLKQDAAMVSVARQVYAKTLIENLPKPAQANGPTTLS